MDHALDWKDELPTGAGGDRHDRRSYPAARRHRLPGSADRPDHLGAAVPASSTTAPASPPGRLGGAGIESFIEAVRTLEDMSDVRDLLGWLR